jgi:hypothetical protein
LQSKILVVMFCPIPSRQQADHPGRKVVQRSAGYQ